jgi:ribosomal protein S18 acetylase RimI-like enzyme
VLIRALCEPDIAAYLDLRAEALLDDPLAFTSSPEDDTSSTAPALRQQLARVPDWMLFIAHDDARMVGSVGMIRRPHRKAAHKMNVWGMYVTPTHRGRGVGAALLDAAIRHAESHDVSWLELGVSSSAPGAQRLYERAGFKVWGAEPDALRYAGESVTEYHMTLRLPRSTS